MSTAKSVARDTAKKILSTLLGEGSVESIYDFENTLACNMSPLFKEHSKRLAEFKDKHRGKRCFIIGNGPSLKEMDLKPLRNEVTFGLNRIYLLFDKIGFTTSYYVSVNGYLIEQCAKEIENINCPKFIRWDYRNHFTPSSEIIYMRSRSVPGFYHDPARDGLWEGTTVTYAAMQLAYFMGFTEVVLIGVDHDFKSKGKSNELVTSTGNDPDHFDPKYFGKGFKWQFPDLATSERAYLLAKEAYEKDGRTIVDATSGGKLQVFPKANYRDILTNNR
ncbi:MAG: 6-hydroxymethylpterin diphosphokinase MptE-like protein [Thermodesulfobacteriota bacterium]